MTKNCQQETRIKGSPFLKLARSEYFILSHPPKKTSKHLLYIFQGHQNISSGILDSYKYLVLSKTSGYFFS